VYHIKDPRNCEKDFLMEYIDQVLFDIQNVVGEIGREVVFQYMKSSDTNLLGAVSVRSYVVHKATGQYRAMYKLQDCYQIRFMKNRYMPIPLKFDKDDYRDFLIGELLKRVLDRMEDNVKSIETLNKKIESDRLLVAKLHSM